MPNNRANRNSAPSSYRSNPYRLGYLSTLFGDFDRERHEMRAAQRLQEAERRHYDLVDLGALTRDDRHVVQPGSFFRPEPQSIEARALQRRPSGHLRPIVPVVTIPEGAPIPAGRHELLLEPSAFVRPQVETSEPLVLQRRPSDHLTPMIPPDTRPRPAGSKTIARLLKRELTDSHKGEDGKMPQCGICLEEHEIGTVVAVLRCSHWFCKECVRTWLRTNGTCPTCRTRVN